MKKRGWYRFAKDVSATDLIMAAATVSIALMTFFYTRYSGKQWKTMEKQTEVAYQQLSSAKASIRVANNALNDARMSEREQSNRAERLVGANEEIAQASVQSLGAARQIAKKSLDATIENVHLEQRAWVGSANITPPDFTVGGKKLYVEEGKAAKCGVIILNSGKTPAKNLRVHGEMVILKEGQKLGPVESFDTTNLPHSEALMLPGTNLIIQTSVKDLTVTIPVFYISSTSVKAVGGGKASYSDHIISKSEVSDLNSGKSTMYVYGTLKYKDIFDGAHQSRFCYYLNTELTAFTGCSTHNDAN